MTRSGDEGSRVSRRALLGGLGAAAALSVVGCSDDDADEGGAVDGGTDGGPGGDSERSAAGGRADPVEPEVIAYGQDSPLQVGALTLTDNEAREPVPVVVLVHGGFWRAGFDRSLMAPLALSLGREGIAAWNLDYRPIGEGGGWPTTFTDVADGIDHLATLAPDRLLDLDRVAVVGHSAGGTLALWSAARAGLPAAIPGADPAVSPLAVVSQAGVTNLAAAAVEGLGRGAAVELMGGQPTGDDGADYLYASPVERLPLGTEVRQLLVHGSADVIVPPAQSETYAARADDAGDEVTLEVVSGADHFVMIDPDGEPWATVLAFLRDAFA